MKHYNIDYYDTDGSDYVKTYSEDDILAEYWDFWYDKMCYTLGKELVDEEFTKEDCINDWVLVNWAWEVENEYPVN